MNTARVREEYDYSYVEEEQVQNSVYETAVIEGYFHKENSVKEMAIRKINKTLCAILGVFIVVAFVSYYFEMSNEITLNTLSRQVTALNDENAELQNNLDRLKSFNNVDNKMVQYNLLQKAAKVIEVPAVASTAMTPASEKKTASSHINWAIGY